MGWKRASKKALISVRYVSTRKISFHKHLTSRFDENELRKALVISFSNGNLDLFEIYFLNILT